MLKRIIVMMIIGALVFSGMSLIAKETKEKQEPQVSKKALKLMKKGDKAAAGKEYDKALEFFQKVIELEPSYPAAHFKKGLVLKIEKKLSEAAPCLDKALELQPNYPDAVKAMIEVLYLSARDLMAKREIEKANELYIKLASYTPPGEREKKVQIDSIYQVALNFYNLRKYSESIQYFIKFIELPGIKTNYKDDFSFSLYMIGLNYYHLSDLQNAINYLEKFLAVNKDNPANKQYLPLAHFIIGSCSYDQLEQEVIKKDKSDIEGVAKLARANKMIIPHFIQALKLKSDIEQAYLKMGNYYYYCRDLDKTIEQYEYLIEHFPNSPDLQVYKHTLETFKKEKAKSTK